MDIRKLKSLVAQWFQTNQPETRIDSSGDQAELVINDRRFDLENSNRLCERDPDRTNDIINHYLTQLHDNTLEVELYSQSFDRARNCIMPRLQPVSIFQHLSREQVACSPLVGDLVIMYVIDFPNMTVSVTTEQMIKWGTTIDDLHELAIRNLATYASEFRISVVESKEGG